MRSDNLHLKDQDRDFKITFWIVLFGKFQDPDPDHFYSFLYTQIRIETLKKKSREIQDRDLDLI